MRTSSRRGLAVAAVAALSLGLGAGTVYGLGLGTSGDESRPAMGGMPADVDKDGLISDTGDERIPELILSDSDHHIGGYVRYEDLVGPEPSNPEEALAMNGQVRVIPVYADDGITQVDTLTITAGTGDDVGSASDNKS